jgi:hypothetical protein
MTAMTVERKIDQLGKLLTGGQAGVAANAETILEHALVRATADGYLVKVGDSTVEGVGPVLGVGRFTVAGGATDGAVSLEYYHGVFRRPNDTTSPVTWASLGKTVYAKDDQTITADPSYPVAGTMWGFYQEQGQSDQVIIEISSTAALLSAAKAGASQPIPLNAWYLPTGDPLAAFADGASPTPGLSLNDSEAAGIRWNDDATPGQIVTSIPIPGDLDPTKVSYVVLSAAKVGATAADVPTFTAEVFEHPVGSAYDAGDDLGSATNAMADEATKTVQVLAAAIAADSFSDPSANTMTATITLQPEAGKLTTDDLVMLSSRLFYSPKI